MSSIRPLRFLPAYVAGAAGAGYAFTAGVFSRRHRGLIVDIARHFGYQHLLVKPTLPQIAINQLLPQNVPMVVPEPEGGEGNVTLLELMVLDQLVRQRSPRNIFEFGTFDGRTTVNFAANAPTGSRVVTLDLPVSQAANAALSLDRNDRPFIEKSISGARYRGSPWESGIEQVYGDSATVNLDRYYNTVDFVFVDASHAYDYVLSDSRRSVQLLRNGRGTIVWHDYASVWPGVTQALHDLQKTDPVFAGLRHVTGTKLAIVTVGQ